MRIGIDFDNTIACYDRSFRKVADMMGLAMGSKINSKSTIKYHILQSASGDLDWQRLQGQVYGKYMLSAEIFPGFLEFLYLCRARGHRVFVVSHKSEFGHFDTERIPLRDQARKWMEINRFFDGDTPLVANSDVYFEPTREAKVARISKLKCTHFIDDLSEVFEEQGFPKATKKILFAPGGDGAGNYEEPIFTSWRELSAALLGAVTEEEMTEIVARRFSQLDLRGVELRKGGGNSRLYRLSLGASHGALALKVYPDRQHDVRTRLQTEFAACEELGRLGYPIPKAYAADPVLNWGLYEWVEGTLIASEDEHFLTDAVGFIERLYSDSRNGVFNHASQQWGLGSEACLSGIEIVHQIEIRLGRLVAEKSPELQYFLHEEFKPLFASATECAQAICGEQFATELPQELQIASPSDFGSHNALRLFDGRTLFLDFEYFGWDDPVKLASDFYWHPAMNLGGGARSIWLSHCHRIFRKDPSFQLRLASYLPLFGLRWSLIILNEFLPRNAAVRVYADPRKANELANIRMAQLDKSAVLLRQIKEMVYELRSTVAAP